MEWDDSFIVDAASAHTSQADGENTWSTNNADNSNR